MKINTRNVEGIIVFDINGRITLGEGDTLLRDAIATSLSNGEKKLLLNLAEVSYIDSSGLGALIGAYTSVKKLGGHLQVIKLTNKVRDLLLITKLYTVLDIKNDEAEAILSLKRAVETAQVIGLAS